MNRPSFNAIWLFLMPALLVVAMVSASNFASLVHVSKQQEQGSAIVRDGLHLLDQAIGLIVQVGLLHDRVSHQLNEAHEGRLDHADTQLIHALVVSQLASIGQSANQLLPQFRSAGLDENQLQQWHNQLLEYYHLAMMATDIIAIEPKTASAYVQRAQSTFFILSAQTFSLTSQLSQRVNEQITDCQNNTQHRLEMSYWFVIAAMFIAIIVAWLSSRYLARQIQILMTQMNLLANSNAIPATLPKVEALTHSNSAEIKRFALSILNFHRAMKAKAEEEARNYQLLFHDPLTGLANRNKMLHILQHILDTPQSKNIPPMMALIKLNVNRLKVVNDGLGYGYGDQLLVNISQHLAENTPYLHTIARSSGDEFLLLLNTLPEDAEKDTLHSIMHLIHQLMLNPFHLGDHDITVSVSMGATLFPRPEEPVNAEGILTQAMLALHSAKQLTQEQSLIYHPSLETTAKQRLLLESRLRSAIEQNRLRLYLQPQVTAQGKMISAETLVRWLDPEEGLISPGVFIPVAEQTDLIIELDRWVIKRACQYLKQVQLEGIPFGLSVNVSGKHFAQDSFVDTICQIIQETEINPNSLILEVTEGVFIADLTAVIDKMNRLREIGIQFSIDDFGTGYSSLQYLKRLPIHELKIDKSFVDGLPDSAEDVALVKTMISIAQNLGLTLVIEGVEHKDQVDFLRTLGSFIMQGYYFAKPQPADVILAQLGVHSTAYL